jgi:putative transposase
MFAAEIRKRRVAHMRTYPQWRWHLDEVFVKVDGKLCYLWRAIDHEGARPRRILVDAGWMGIGFWC